MQNKIFFWRSFFRNSQFKTVLNFFSFVFVWFLKSAEFKVLLAYTENNVESFQQHYIILNQRYVFLGNRNFLREFLRMRYFSFASWTRCLPGNVSLSASKNRFTFNKYFHSYNFPISLISNIIFTIEVG